MNSLKKLYNEINWKILVYTFWFTVMVKVVLTGEYIAFLRPGFVFVAVLAVISLLIFIFAACSEDTKEVHSRKNSLFRTMILIMPLLYYLNAQGEILGAQAFSKRSTGMPVISGSVEKSANSGITLEADSDTSEPLDINGDAIFQIPDELVPDLSDLTIIDLYDMPEKFLGKKITVSGMLHKDDPELKNQDGAVIPLIYRFVITCCAADALPAAILVNRDNMVDFQEGEWVEVSGRFETIKKGDDNIPVINDPEVKKIPAPQEPYLY